MSEDDIKAVEAASDAFRKVAGDDKALAFHLYQAVAIVAGQSRARGLTTELARKVWTKVCGNVFDDIMRLAREYEGRLS